MKTHAEDFIGSLRLQFWNAVEGRFSNPLFNIFLIPTIILHGNARVAHALIVKIQNNVR